MANEAQSQGPIERVRLVEVSTSKNNQIANDAAGTHRFPHPNDEAWLIKPIARALPPFKRFLTTFPALLSSGLPLHFKLLHDARRAI
jgi:hypothetical protein